MRLTAIIAGLFLCAFVFLAPPVNANAQALDEFSRSNTKQNITMDSELAVIEFIESQNKEVKNIDSPVPITHIVAPGDTLTKVAEQHQTTIERVFAKNTEINNPDVIEPGQKLIIPEESEVLPERQIEAVPEESRESNGSPRTTVRSNQSVRTSSVSGNSYTPGYCTYYAKNRRPDLPNNLGNANTWVSRAAAQGVPTGSVPRAGAIGQQGMHVVYVERVNGDGTVTISEMNWGGLFKISSRTVAASNFQYIY